MCVEPGGELGFAWFTLRYLERGARMHLVHERAAYAWIIAI